MAAGVGNGRYIYYWEYEEFSAETVHSIKTPDHGIIPYLSYYDINKIRVRFDGGCLKQDQSIILFKGIVSIYIVYEITNNFNISDYPTLESCLFGAVKLTKKLILTNMKTLVMELDLIDMQVFRFLDLD